MIDEPVDLDVTPPADPFAGQGGGASVEQFPTLSRSLGRRTQDPRAMALQERRAADTEHIADRRFAVEAQRLELQKIQHLTELHKEESMIRQGFETQRQHQTALKGLLAIKPGDDPVAAATQILADNPQASKDPAIMDIFRSHVSTAQARRAAEINSRLFQEKQNMELETARSNRKDVSEMAAARKAELVAAGMKPSQGTEHDAGGSETYMADKKPVEKTHLGPQVDAAKIAASESAQYGTYDATKKVFTPVESGKGDQTHVRLTYNHPTKGITTETLSRADYEAQMNARKAAAAQVASASAVIPDDHAAFLRAHPDKAASFDETYGAGASAKILGR